MYQIFNNGALLGDNTYSEYVFYNGQLSEKINTAGTLTFTVLESNPELANVQLLKSIISLYQDGVEIWRGRVRTSEIDLYNRRTLTCEGALAFFYDIRDNDIHTTTNAQWSLSGDTPTVAITNLLTKYNASCTAGREIQLGNIQPTAKVRYDFRGEYITIFDTLAEIIAQIGGYYKLRFSGGVAYLDLLNVPATASGQEIIFADNLLDITRFIDGSKIMTQMYADGPYNLRTTVTNASLVSAFGVIQGYQCFDGVDSLTNLETVAQEYFDTHSLNEVTISLSAVDLSLLDTSIEAFYIGQLVHISSTPHGINVNILLSEMVTDLNNPTGSRITLGASFTGVTKYVQNSIKEGQNSIYRKLETAYTSGVNAV